MNGPSNNGGLIRACRGPIVLMTLGFLTAADTFWQYPFSRTWPTLLILFGLLKLAEKAMDSHDDGPYPQGPAGYAGYPGQGGFGAPVSNAPANPPPVAPSSSDAPKSGDGQ